MAWITPLIARGVAGATGLPIGLIAIVALYALAMRRATAARTGSRDRHHRNRASVILICLAVLSINICAIAVRQEFGLFPFSGPCDAPAIGIIV